MTQVQCLKGRSRVESADQMLDVLNPSASILLCEEGLDLVGRRADKRSGQMKDKTTFMDLSHNSEFSDLIDTACA